ncbi:MAG: glycosyltransferase family 4 protein [Cyanobacteria bacterium P01_H01_bin.74]
MTKKKRQSIKLGFDANPTGGPGIFMTRLKHALEETGQFDVDNPDAWIQLCYRPLPEAIKNNRKIQKIIRIDGVYTQQHQFIYRPIKIQLPWLDRWKTIQKNKKKNKPIQENLNKADALVFQSEFSRKVLHHFIQPTKPGHLIFNGVDPRIFKPARAYPNNPKHIHILISHAFRPLKRLHEAIQVTHALQKHLERSQSVTLHVVGHDDGQCFAHAKELMQTLTMSPNSVVFHGKQPFETLYALYTRCHFFLGVSFWDFCPNVVVEALACGLPILGVDFGGIPELMGDAGITIPESISVDYMDLDNINALPKIEPAAYVNAAIKILENLSDYQVLARERALCALDIRTVAKQYCAVSETQKS